jgi:hypothetical protein
MRVALVCLAVVAVVGATAAPAAAPPLVPCGEIIGAARSGNAGGWRIVLGEVAVPPAHFGDPADLGQGPWRYWQKWGLGVRAGGRQPVRISVPRGWRHRVAFVWGNSLGVVQDLRIARCGPRGGKRWNAYAGGFFLRSRGDCVPLTFSVGTRSRTVWFGIGRRCG